MTSNLDNAQTLAASHFLNVMLCSTRAWQSQTLKAYMCSCKDLNKNFDVKYLWIVIGLVFAITTNILIIIFHWSAFSKSNNNSVHRE